MEDVVVTLTWRTSPDVTSDEPHSFNILQVSNEYLMIDSRPQVTRLEKVHTVQVGDVHTPLIGLRAV